MHGTKILLVEDDWIISKEISFTLQDIGFEIMGCFDNAEEAYQQIKKNPPELVILDIDLSGEMTGINLATKLKQEGNIPFIFITALADINTLEKAKLVEPYAYLVKPIAPETLYSTIEITLHNAAKRNAETSSLSEEFLEINDFIFVKNKKRLEKINLKDILWAEAFDVYTKIKTINNQYLLNHSLKVVEEKFPSTNFIRIHRSFLINKDKIEAIVENNLIINNAEIPIGKTYKDALMRKLSIL